MKKFVVLLLIIITLLSFAGCKKDENHPEETPLYMQINGDIEGFSQQVNLLELTIIDFSYEKEGEEQKYSGYKISEVIEKITLNDEENFLLFTAKDGISARIELVTADLCYLVVEEDKINIKAPDHPPVVGIKDLQQITVISKNDNITEGLKIVSEQGVEVISRGNIRLLFFKQVSQNLKNNNVAYKHVPKNEEIKLDTITSTDNVYLYAENFDIINVNNNIGKLLWNNGQIGYQNNSNNIASLIGIVSGASKIVYDAYDIMKSQIDSGKKVMFILPDGFSYEQVTYYANDLNLLGSGYEKATSVNPAISNVSLATIVTGVSPYNTGIIERGVKKPDKQDIFDYALSQGKSVKYIEGNGNLIATNIQPIYNVPDINGDTDQNVFNSAMTALEDNPDLIFIHFHGIDDYNHEYSPISQQAKSKILQTEDYIIQLMENFEGTVIIVPDHGAITYTDKEGNLKGRHGYFEDKDMYVPFYVFEDSFI